ncbi:NADH oxidase-related protein [Trichomonas vaginalis G3]|uniref:NADH oxidase-related protein n=1 Tax=Trichomonas vaginalis (strain ATCC PRA-98 / G3) TaxID=412133 RepID=A2F787_TRIV3|nr:FMN binding [Trichomonas vaginalis G3]EAX99254.1 NADH oxidase-related protein [Trichomonas vaginalis G3]KAI5547927.1 FMN binding [Trichomonas vaginalis G3]|eukprot:XP_001312184.1 NADH oxidase-related protein [Trichomonas vaginalis G3]
MKLKNGNLISKSDNSKAIEFFASAVKRAQHIGAAGIEFHGAHVYLLSIFLPKTNPRDDQYGGETKSRFRFLQECVDAFRFLSGKDFIVAAKINADDWAKGRNKPEDAAKSQFLSKELIYGNTHLVIPTLRKGTDAKLLL